MEPLMFELRRLDPFRCPQLHGSGVNSPKFMPIPIMGQWAE